MTKNLTHKASKQAIVEILKAIMSEVEPEIEQMTEILETKYRHGALVEGYEILSISETISIKLQTAESLTRTIEDANGRVPGYPHDDINCKIDAAHGIAKVTHALISSTYSGHNHHKELIWDHTITKAYHGLLNMVEEIQEMANRKKVI